MLNKMTLKNDKTMAIFLRRVKFGRNALRYLSKYRDIPGVLGYDIAMLVYRYFYKFKF